MNATVRHKRMMRWLRPALAVCLLVLTALAMGPSFAGHANSAASAPQISFTVGDQNGAEGAGVVTDCAVHAVCQAATLAAVVTVPGVDGCDEYASVPMLFLPDINAPPLPQPPNTL